MRTSTIIPMLLAFSTSSLLACSGMNNGSGGGEGPPPIGSAPAVQPDGGPGGSDDSKRPTADGGTSAAPVDGGGGTKVPTATCATDKFSYSPGHGYDIGKHGPTPLTAGDLNGDGKADLAAAISDTKISVLLNKGDGTFGAPVYSTGFGWLGRLADITGDGAIDFVSDDRYFPGNGDGTFGLEVKLPGTGANITNGAIVEMVKDMNGDAIPDVVMTTGKIQVLMNAGKGEIAVPIEYGNNFDARLATGDFNGDGKPDLVGTGRYGSVLYKKIEVLMNAGGGTFPQGTAYVPNIPNSSGGTAAPAAGDFNGDGKDDFAVLATPDGYASELHVFLNKGDGTFDSNRAKVYPVSMRSPRDIVAGDFNGDGKIDLAAAVANAVAVMMGKGDGTFATPVELAAGDNMVNLVAADFAGNGFLSLAAVEYSGKAIVFLAACH